MGLLDRMLGRPAARRGSSATAKKRLKLVLEYDRAQLSPGQLELIKDDIIQAISRHVQVARNEVAVKLEHGGRLVAEIPLVRDARSDSALPSDDGGEWPR